MIIRTNLMPHILKSKSDPIKEMDKYIILVIPPQTP